jgi:hypothetical protein
VHAGRKRLAKIHQILLVKIAKLGGGKWGNKFGSALARVVIGKSEGGRWVVVVVGEGVGSALAGKRSQVIPAHLSICTGGKFLITGAQMHMRRGYFLSSAHKLCICHG